MSDLCRLIWCGLIELFRSRAALEAEILVLRHQLNILRRKSPKGQRAINSAHSRESACEDIGVAGAMLVVAPSPHGASKTRVNALIAGEGNSMLPQTMMG